MSYRARSADCAGPTPSPSTLRTLRVLAGLLLISLSAGCSSGGGGGGGAPPPPATIAPTGLSYPVPGPLLVGVLITPLAPSLATGSGESYTVAPTLPAGLTLDSSTGEITGTPTVATPLTTFTLTATNSAGSSTFALSLEVVDAPIPVVTFALPDNSAAESSGVLPVVLLLSFAGTDNITVALLVSGDASPGVDFTAPATPVLIPAGQVSATIDLVLLDDDTDEPDETVVLTLDSPTNAVIGFPSTHTVALLDDDARPLVQFTAGALAVPEASGAASIDVTLDHSSSAPIDVSLAITGSAQPGVDYTLTPASLSFPPGQTLTQLTLLVLDDLTFEGDEAIGITLIPGAGADPGSPIDLFVTIGEDDPPPTVEIFGGGVAAVEGSGPVTLTVALSDLSGMDATISFGVGGSATIGVDYLAPPTPVTIPAGSLSADLDFDPLADGAIEGSETVDVTLIGATDATLGVVTTASFSIEDGTAPFPVVTLTGGGTITEGSGLINLTVTLSTVSATPVTVLFDLAGTATPGIDFAPPANPVMIPAGSLTAPITIEPVDDGTSEGSETATVTLLSAVGATLGAGITATVTIEDVAILEVELAGGGTLLESGAPLDLLVTLSAPAPAPVDVFFDLAGTATIGLDYTATASPATILTGGTAVAITIAPIPDGTAEGPETIDVTLTAATGANLGATVTATVTIDEATVPAITLSGGGVAGVEGAGPLFLTVSLSAPSGQSVQVSFAFSGSATPGSDFITTASPLTILPGNLTDSIAIDPLPDGVTEPDETVEVTLIGATGAILGAVTTQTVTILNDASAPVPPTGLSYSDPVAVYPPGTLIVPNVPSLQGGAAASFDVVPLLPIGLLLDPVTGTITGTPLFEQPANSYTITATNPAGQASTTISIEVRTVFEFAMSNPVVPYSSATGLATFVVSLTVRELTGQSTGNQFTEIHRLSGGIAFDDQQLIATQVEVGGALLPLNGGLGPEFYITTPIPGGGLTFGIIFSFGQLDTIIAPTASEWAAITFEAVPGYLTGDVDGETLILPWDATLGSPPVENRIVYGGNDEQVPVQVDGTITFVP